MNVPQVAIAKFYYLSWTIVLLGIAVGWGVAHDYIAYLQQWALVLAGSDPWQDIEAGRNAYGPVHNLLALLMPAHFLAPKLVIAGVFAVATSMLFLRLLKVRGLDRGSIWIFALAIPANALITLFGAGYGSNDLLTGAFVVFAILSRLDSRPALFGFWISLAILTKFYPALLVPLFALDRGRFDLRYILYAGLFTVIGLAATYVMWGSAMLQSVIFGGARGYSFISGLRVVHVIADHLGVPIVTDVLVKYNSLMLLATFACGVALCWWARCSWLVGIVAVFISVLLIYKVGHPQFFTTWCCAVAALPLLREERADSVAWLSLPMLLALSITSYVYVFHDGVFYGSSFRMTAWALTYTGIGLAVTASIWIFVGQQRFGAIRPDTKLAA